MRKIVKDDANGVVGEPKVFREGIGASFCLLEQGAQNFRVDQLTPLVRMLFGGERVDDAALAGFVLPI